MIAHRRELDVAFKLPFAVGPAYRFSDPKVCCPRTTKMNGDCSAADNEAKEKHVLDLFNVGSKKYFDTIPFSQNLLEVRVSNSFIRAIPSELSMCDLLEKLDLSHNLIHSLSDVLYSLKHLVELNLSHNRLRSIKTEDTYKLFMVKSLCVSHNSISHIASQVWRLSLLEELSIDANCLKSIPTSIADMHGLKLLRIDWPLYVSPASSAELSRREDISSRGETSAARSRVSLSLDEVCDYLRELANSSAAECSIHQFMARFSRPAHLEATPAHLRTALVSRHQAVFNQLFDSLRYSSLHHFREPQRSLESVIGADVTEYLIFALKTGSYSIASHLISTEYSKKPDSHYAGECPLHVAVESCDLDCIRLLLNAGHPPDCCDAQGNTPLHKLFLLANHGCFFDAVISRMNDHITQIKGDSFDSSDAAVDYWSLAFVHFDAFLHSSSTVSSDKHFSNLQLDILAVFLDHSADPNRYNKVGLCPWHYTFFKTDLYMFASIQASDGRFDRIDWNVPFFFGQIPTLHIASQLDYWHCLVNLIVGKKKITTLGIDMYLQPAGKYICWKNGKVPFKHFLKVFKKDLKHHFNGLTCEKLRLKNLMKKSYERAATNRNVQFSTTLKHCYRKTGKLKLNLTKTPTISTDQTDKFSHPARSTTELDMSAIDRSQGLADDSHSVRPSILKHHTSRLGGPSAAGELKTPLRDALVQPANDVHQTAAASSASWLKLTIPHMKTISRPLLSTGFGAQASLARRSFIKSELSLHSQPAPLQCDDTDENTNFGSSTNRLVSTYRLSRSPGHRCMRLSTINAVLNAKIATVICKKLFKELISLKLAIKNLTVSEPRDLTCTASSYILYTISSHLAKLSIVLARLGAIMSRDVSAALVSCVAEKLFKSGVAVEGLNLEVIDKHLQVRPAASSQRIDFEVIRYLDTIRAAMHLFKPTTDAGLRRPQALAQPSAASSPLIKLPCSLAPAGRHASPSDSRELLQLSQAKTRPTIGKMHQPATSTQLVLKNIREKYLSSLRRECASPLQ